MKNKLIFTMILSTAVTGSGCASQEDMLYTDLWSGDTDSYEPKSNEDVRDLGKTPRDKMLEQRRIDEERENRSIKDNLIRWLFFS